MADLAHGRRKFVDVVENFERECRRVIDALTVIYKNDEEARKGNMTPEQRLAFHQRHSKATMDSLHKWLQRQFDDRLVEPNSGLGQAITYMLNRWDQLTRFLRKAGAPLDNNICERALKTNATQWEGKVRLFDKKAPGKSGDLCSGRTSFDSTRLPRTSFRERAIAPASVVPISSAAWRRRGATAARRPADRRVR